MTRFLSLLGAAAVGAFLLWLFSPERSPDPPSLPRIDVENMGHLVALNLAYSDVIEMVAPTSVGIPNTRMNAAVGSGKALVVLRGTCQVGTDLRLARHEPDVAHRTVLLTLPSPKRLTSGLQHGKSQGGSYVYTTSSTGLVKLLPGSEDEVRAINAAMAHGQRKLNEHCDLPQWNLQARKQAEEVLGGIFRSTGWTARFVWK